MRSYILLILFACSLFVQCAGVEPGRPIATVAHLYDFGVTDMNSDGSLDIFTASHGYKSLFLKNTGNSFEEDPNIDFPQNQEFPGLEPVFQPRNESEPGVHIYWLGRNLILNNNTNHSVRGFLLARGVESGNGLMTLTVVDGEIGGYLKADYRSVFYLSIPKHTYASLLMAGNGPIAFDLSDTGLRPDELFIGAPAAHPDALVFHLELRDRHAMAWAPGPNNAFRLFIVRGGLSGTSQTEGIAQNDELIFYRPDGAYTDIGPDLPDRRGCSGQQTAWVDVNHDGALDLFIICRRSSALLYLATPEGYAAQSDLVNISRNGAFIWNDVDNNGLVDLLWINDSGIFVHYHRVSDKEEHFFESEVLYDDGSMYGTISAADMDDDGYSEFLFASSFKNFYIENENGRLTAWGAFRLGLPNKSRTGQIVDYDGDGVYDIYLFPDGIYTRPRNTAYTRLASGLPAINGGNRFRPSGQLTIEDYDGYAKMQHWGDFDNNGSLDLILARKNDPICPECKGYTGQTHDLVLFKNDQRPSNWLQVQLQGNHGNHPGIGARLELTTDSGIFSQTIGQADAARLSQGHYRAYFYRPAGETMQQLEIYWPDGYRQTENNIRPNRLLTVHRDG